MFRDTTSRSRTLAHSENRSFVAALAARYNRRLRRFLAVHLRDVHDVPDLAQEVFLRLLRVSRHEAIRNPEAYLFTVASHVLQQHALRRSTNPAFIDITEAVSELTASAEEDPTTRSDNAQRIEHLERMLAQLPPRVGATLVMHRLGGYTIQEIADELGVARETAKKYLARAAQHCRKSSVGTAISD